jgi:hypothetical protein
VIKQPNKWTCYPTAIAIATGMPLEDIMNALTHDGSKPSEIHPCGHEGFHQSEIALALLRLGYALVSVYASTDSTNYPSFDEITDLMLIHNCVIVIRLHHGGLHCLAWDGVSIYDPDDGKAIDWDKIEKVVNVEAVIRI